MIADWYFCCCIRSTPEQTESFLNILDVLERPQNIEDEALVHLAFEELQRTEIWMQIYAMPKVIIAFSRDQSLRGFAQIIRSYLDNLIELLPTEIRPMYFNLVQLLLASPASEQMYRMIEDIASRTFPATANISATAPYLDSQQFLPQEFVLAACLFSLHKYPSFASILLNSINDEEELTSIGSIFMRASSMELGRLAFVLSAQIAAMVCVDDLTNHVSDTIWEHLGDSSQFEPDLLTVYSKMIFSDSLGQTAPNSQAELVNAIIHESLSFSIISKRIATITPARTDRAPFLRIGFEPGDQLISTLGLIYWQIVLWELAINVAPTAFASLIPPYWQPLAGDSQRNDSPLRIKSPFPASEWLEWQSKLSSLIRLRGGPLDNLEIQRQSSSTLEVDPFAKWFLASPWLSLDDRDDVFEMPKMMRYSKASRGPENSRSPNWRSRYPTAHVAPLLIRLMSCACISAQILRALPDVLPSRETFLSILIHTSDVLRSCYRDWLYHHTEGNETDFPLRLTMPLTGLAKFVDDVVNLIGRGHTREVTPDYFIRLLESEVPTDEENHQETNLNRDFRFRRFIIPEVLTDWIGGAYPGAQKGSNAARWIPYIPMVFEHHKYGIHDTSEEVEVALLVRFLTHPFYAGLDLTNFDWRKNDLSQARTGWPTEHRLLLLTLPLPPSEWIKPEWGEQNLMGKQGVLLVRALERFASFEQVSDTLVDWSNYEESWSLELLDLLNSLPENADRFIRLRLVEIIQSPICGPHLDLQKLIVLSVMEYGSIYDLDQLLGLILSRDRGRSVPNVMALRSFLIEVCYRELNSENVKRRYGSASQDPRLTYEAIQKRNIIKNYLALVLHESSVLHEKDEYGDYTPLLRQLSAQSNTAPLNDLRCVERDITIIGRQKAVVTTSKSQAIPHWRLAGAIVDPNQGKVTLLINDLESTNLLNLFEMSEIDLTELLRRASAGQSHVLAVLSNVEKKEGGSHIYTFNCGMPSYLHLSSDQKLPFEVGQFVQLNIRKIQQNSWVIDGAADIHPLRTAIRNGDKTFVTVKEFPDPRSQRNNLQLTIQGIPHSQYHFQKDIWDPDVSRSFVMHSTIEKQVVAECNPESNLVPLEMNFLSMLLEEFTDAGNSITITLVAKDQRDARGRTGVVFSARPGENYFLYPDDFLPPDFDKMIEEFERYPDPNGLLVTVNTVPHSGTVRLHLVESRTDASPSPGSLVFINTPFDDRNIVWRNLFQSVDTQIANRVGDYWYLNLPENSRNPFPNKLLIDWTKYKRPGITLDTVDCIVSGWKNNDPRSGTVIASYVPYNRLVPLQRKKEFCERWLRLTVGSTLSVERIIGGLGKDGFVTCLTQDGVPVKVEGESINMDYAKDINSFIFDTARTIEILDIRHYRKPIDEFTESDVPSEAIQNGRCKGIIWQIPSRNFPNATVCEVVWVRDNAEPIQRPLQIVNLDRLRPLNTGDLIEGKVTSQRLILQINSLRIKARALWRLASTYDSTMKLIYLGTTSFEGKTVHLAQSRHGSLVILPEDQTLAPHLAIGNIEKFERGLDASQPFLDNSGIQTDFENRATTAPLSRALLTSENGTITGYQRLSYNGKYVTVLETRIRLLRNPNFPDLFSLWREFRTKPVQAHARSVQEHTTNANAISGELFIERLDEYFDAPRDLDAVFLKRGDTPGVLLSDQSLRVPEGPSAPHWSSWVPLGPNEGAFFAEADNNYDPEEARVRLYRTADQKVYASFRRVSAKTPDEFRDLLQAEFDRAIQFRYFQLHYIGREINQREPNSHSHRFEWGYGLTLLVPDDQILYNENAFESSQFFIFHGDIIKSLTFHRDPQTDKSVLSIRDALVLPSRATRLYRQGVRHQLINVLHLRIAKNSIQIESIEGLDETPTATTGFRIFEQIHARLSEKSEKAILQQASSSGKLDDHSGERLAIYGRLDSKRFKRTNGREVLFEHVSLSFAPSGPGSALRNGDRIFFTAGSIERKQNDVVLNLRCVQGIRQEEIGADLSSALFIRSRAFSIREDLLRSIYQSAGESYFEKDQVRVIATVSLLRPQHPYIDMINVPNRSLTTLKGEIESQGGALYATVAKEEDFAVRIELKPGVFFELSKSNLEGRFSDLRRGTVVKLQRAHDSKLQLSVAAPSAQTYITSTPRLAVVFPKNKLIRAISDEPSRVKDGTIWLDRNTYLVGGFPDVEASPGTFLEPANDWRPPNPSDFTQLMNLPHPKTALVGKDNQGVIRLSPLSGEELVGWLELGDDNLSVNYRKVSQVERSSDRRPLEWRYLTFSDSTARNIIETLESEKTVYQQKYTGHWTASGDSQSQYVETKPAIQMPQFFTSEVGNMTLRYPPEKFRLLGYPLPELIQSLKGKLGQRHLYPVAGPSDHGGLWIEISPGRIAELPGDMIVFFDGIKEVSLSSLDWRLFSSGDKVDLALLQTGPIQIPRIGLLGWTPSPRKAFGNGRVFLTVTDTYLKEGATVLGSGQFRVTVPIAHPTITSGGVMLSSHNDIAPAEPSALDSGDTLLLKISPTGQIGAEAIPDYQVKPAPWETGAWEGDQLASYFASQSTSPTQTPNEQAIQLLKVVGGSLPVTVERVDHANKTAYFSRRMQRTFSNVPQGSIVCAKVLGFDPARSLVFLNYSTGIACMSPEELISGIPDQLANLAITFLKNKQVLIWLRSDGSSLLHGMAPQIRSQFNVLALATIEHSEEETRQTGIICRSIESCSLFWLPSEFAAWSVLSKTQLETLFVNSPQRYFKVQLLPESGVVSILHRQDVKKEFSQFFIGREIVVRLILQDNAARSNASQYIAQSTTSNTLLRCELPNSTGLPVGEYLPAEVSALSRAPTETVTAVAAGLRKQTLEMPLWMLDHQRRDNGLKQMSRFLACHPSYLQLDQIRISDLDALSNEDLDDLLTRCYLSSRSGTEFPLTDKAKLCNEWRRRYFTRADEDLFVPTAIAAILLLSNTADQAIDEARSAPTAQKESLFAQSHQLATDARTIFQSLGQRALRSHHLEVLSRKWLLHPFNRNRVEDLWRALNQSAGMLSRELDTRAIRRIRQLIRTIQLRNRRDLTEIGNALAAALGEAGPFDNLFLSAPLTTAFVRMASTLPISASGISPSLGTFHLDFLERILSLMSAQNFGLTFLNQVVLTPYPTDHH